MRLLLDTHALIWVVQSPQQLGDDARAALIADDAEVYASHVSLWEMAIKRGVGRLEQLERKAGDWFEHFVPRSGLRPLPIAAGQKPRLVGTWVNLNARFDIVGGAMQGQYDVDHEFLGLTPVGCSRIIPNPACAHGSYFQAANEAVNRDIFAQYITS